MKLVIGITGLPLAGKETVANELAGLIQKDSMSVSRHTFSDILRETLDVWGLPHGRDNEQKMAIVMNHDVSFGDGTLSRAMKKRLMDSSEDVAVLDGVRWSADEKMLRELPNEGVKSIIVFVNASTDRRFARLQSRNRAHEGKTTRAEFDAQQKVRTEIEIEAIGSRADIKIDNDSDDRAKLQKEIERVYTSKIKPLLS